MTGDLMMYACDRSVCETPAGHMQEQCKSPIWLQLHSLPVSTHLSLMLGPEQVNFIRWTQILKKVCVCVCVFNHVWLCDTPWTKACQALMSMEFSRQEYWSGLPFPSPGDLPDPGIEPTSPMFPVLAGRPFTTSATWEVTYYKSWLQFCNVNSVSEVQVPKISRRPRDWPWTERFIGQYSTTQLVIGSGLNHTAFRVHIGKLCVQLLPFCTWLEEPGGWLKLLQCWQASLSPAHTLTLGAPKTDRGNPHTALFIALPATGAGHAGHLVCWPTGMDNDSSYGRKERQREESSPKSGPRRP